MIKVTNNSVNGIHDVKEMTADTLDDITGGKIPNCGMGSFILVIETSQVFVKNSKGEWKEI